MTRPTQGQIGQQQNRATSCGTTSDQKEGQIRGRDYFLCLVCSRNVLFHCLGVSWSRETVFLKKGSA